MPRRAVFPVRFLLYDEGESGPFGRGGESNNSRGFFFQQESAIERTIIEGVIQIDMMCHI
jgi:hypothetical protein